MKNILTIVSLALCTWIHTPNLVAQESADTTAQVPNTFLYNQDHFTFADFRYGYSKLGHNFHTGFNYKYRYNIFKIGYSQINNFKEAKLNNHFNEVSFLYGWSFRKNNFLFSAAFGIGGVWGNSTTNQKRADSIYLDFDPQIKVKTVGFPLEINFAFTPPPKLKTFSSIGLVFFGNFNNDKSYLGVGLNLALGKVSPKLTEAQQKDPLKDYYVPKVRKQKWYD
ncbi:MAG TPA: hypothetical protein VLZ75_10435 [Chitinophagales bacterium]|nr:hypothetical protein [Chitinophagales bacterium]